MSAGLRAAIASLVVAGCNPFGPAEPTIVDGWSIGAPITDCSEIRSEISSCDYLVELAGAAAGLEAGAAGTVHREGGYRARDGSTILSNRSGGSMYVVVLRLADGTVRAEGVFCGVGECRAGGTPAYRR